MRVLFALGLCLLGVQAVPLSPQTDAKQNARTESANSESLRSRQKSGAFPSLASTHLVSGELVEVDYIHRCGVFRKEGTGERIDFTMPPFGSVLYLNAEADLRDVPLGTLLRFALTLDAQEASAQAVLIQDEYTLAAREGCQYRLDAVEPQTGRLRLTRLNAGKSAPDAASTELLLEDSTPIWRDGKPVPRNSIQVGETLLFDSAGGSPRRCTGIWVGAEAQRLATEQQRKRHFAFVKERGLPARIDSVDGERLTVTLFGADPASLQLLFKAEGIDPAQWAKEHRRIAVAVANEHLRSYLPNVTNRGAIIEEFQNLPSEGIGCGGVRWVLRPELMLEGFRRGRIVRLFPGSWPIEAMPFGEGLFAGGHDEEPADSKELQPAEYPYRTDFGNENLPWYRLQPSTFPPDYSEHRVGGELVKVDAARRSGVFRKDGTGELVNFTLPPFASVLYCNAEAELADLPLGMRCLFFLYPDEKGAFTRAGVVEDEFSYLAANTLTYRLETAQIDAGRLVVVRHAAPVKVDYVLEPRVPTDFGRIELEVDARTRVWKGDRQIALRDLVPGDDLLVNLAARTQTSRGRCTDIWVGAETHRIATEQQRRRHAAFLKANGLPGWIESVEGNDLVVIPFSANRTDTVALLGPDPYGKSVHLILSDDQRNPQGSVETFGFKAHLPEAQTFATYGSSGIRWLLSAPKLPEGYRKGRIIRLFPADWSLPSASSPSRILP